MILRKKQQETSVVLDYIRVCHMAPLGAGGISTMVMNICTHMNRDYINFDYLTFRTYEEFFDERVREYGGIKYVADVGNINNGFIRAFLKFLRTYKVLKENKVKILHINASFPYDAIVGLAAKASGVKKVIFHSHNSNMDKGNVIKSIVMRSFKWLIPLVSDYNFACSQLAAEYMFPRKIVKSKKFKIINNGIEVSKYTYNPKIRKQYRKKYNCEDNLVIGHIGRFVEQKNHSFLIDIFSEIHKMEPKSILYLIGIGELKEKIKAKVEQLGLEDFVVFFGTSNEVQNMLQMFDVFLFPSLYEGLPVVGVEVQAAGLPIIVSDTITREVRITNLIEFVSLNESAEHWAEKVIKHKNSYIRRDTSQHIIDAGFSIDDTVRTLEDIYKQC